MLGPWKLKDFAPGEGEAQRVHEGPSDADGWIDVAVPGDVHTALLAAGRIADPYYNTQELDCAWVEQRVWWYTTTFVGPTALGADERLQLVFEGLDTFATVWLNGQELGRTANMFREHVFDVSTTVRPGAENSLVLCFQPPLEAVAGKPVPGFGTLNIGAEPSKTLMRKAQFGYGWDWGPRLPTIGIWRPVALRRQRAAALDGVHFVTESLATGLAQVAVRVDVDRFAVAGALSLTIALSDAQGMPVGGQTVSLPADDMDGPASITFSITDPHLWWTHDLGEPYLYTLDVALEQDGVRLDQVRQSVGIRTIVLDQSPDPDEPGTRFFRFVLNGVPIFARGGDWIPADSFVGAIPSARYERWIKATRAGNMNMLRIWGGGIYEHESFYESCDRHGVLVWQDFMFACAAYPDDDAVFVEEVRREAIYQVKRLRNHPCMAAWVGNNECQMVGAFAKMFAPDLTTLPGDLLYETVLPDVVREHDGAVPYWPGSPYGGRHPNDQAIGDVHDWTVWHGMSEDANIAEIFTKGPTPEQVAYTRYAEDQGRFISEFGMHASPVIDTLRRVIPEDQLYHHSPSMDHHNKDNPKNKGDLLMMTSTGLPKDLPEYIDFSMLAQAEGLKFGIEHFRRRKPHCSGTLIWQLNDCWPVLSWAIMDYYGFGKAGYYYTRRVYAPVLASFKALPDGSVELWITNDTLQPVETPVVVKYGDFAEGTLWTETLDLSVPANASQVVWRCAADRVAARPDRYLAVRSPGQAFPANRIFFTALKDLERKIVAPQIRVTAVSDQELRVHVEATAYVHFFHVLLPDEQAHLSDNFFDLAAGESAEIVVTAPSTLYSAQLRFGWR